MTSVMMSAMRKNVTQRINPNVEKLLIQFMSKNATLITIKSARLYMIQCRTKIATRFMRPSVIQLMRRSMRLRRSRNVKILVRFALYSKVQKPFTTFLINNIFQRYFLAHSKCSNIIELFPYNNRKNGELSSCIVIRLIVIKGPAIYWVTLPP